MDLKDKFAHQLTREELAEYININWLEIYEENISTGKVHVNKWIKLVIERFYRDQENGTIVVNSKKGNRWIVFIEQFIKLKGRNISLTKVQKAIFWMFFSAMDSEDTDIRYYKTLFIEVCRGFGKSTISAIFQAASFEMNKNYSRKFYNIATDRKQARLILDPIIDIVNGSKKFQDLGYYVTGSGEDKRILNKKDKDFECSIKTQDSDTLQGMDYSNVALDEVHTWRNKDILHSITGGRKQEESFEIIISTGGLTRFGLFDHLVDIAEDVLINPNDNKLDTMLAFMYKVEDYENFTSDIEIEKGNPSLHEKYFRQRKKTIYENIEKSQRSGSFSPEFLATSFGMKVSGESSWFRKDDFAYNFNFEMTDELAQEPWFIGIDPAQKNDLSSVVAVRYRQKTGEMFCINRNFTNVERYKALKLMNRMPVEKYVKRKELVVAGRKFNDDKVLVDYVKDLYSEDGLDLNIIAIGYDVNGTEQMVNMIVNETPFEKGEDLFPVPQSPNNLFDHTKLVEKCVYNEDFYFNENLFLTQILNGEKLKKVVGKNELYIIDNPKRELLHDAVSALLTALSARQKYRKKYEIYNDIV